jgi:hypothetical protein
VPERGTLYGLEREKKRAYQVWLPFLLFFPCPFSGFFSSVVIAFAGHRARVPETVWVPRVPCRYYSLLPPSTSAAPHPCPAFLSLFFLVHRGCMVGRASPHKVTHHATRKRGIEKLQLEQQKDTNMKRRRSNAISMEGRGSAANASHYKTTAHTKQKSFFRDEPKRGREGEGRERKQNPGEDEPCGVNDGRVRCAGWGGGAG